VRKSVSSQRLSEDLGNGTVVGFCIALLSPEIFDIRARHQDNHGSRLSRGLRGGCYLHVDIYGSHRPTRTSGAANEKNRKARNRKKFADLLETFALTGLARLAIRQSNVKNDIDERLLDVDLGPSCLLHGDLGDRLRVELWVGYVLWRNSTPTRRPPAAGS
jgi:hypothetical protein